MHDELFALEANWLAAMVSVLAITMWGMIWFRTRQGYALLNAVGWLGLCCYWSLLAISAGPAPVLVRGDIAVAVRILLLVSAIALGAGKLWLFVCAWRADADDWQ